MVETKKEPSIRRLTMTESAEHFSRRNFLKTVGSAAHPLIKQRHHNPGTILMCWSFFLISGVVKPLGATVIPLSEHLILIG